ARAGAARRSAQQPVVAAGGEILADRRRPLDLHHLREHVVDRSRMARARARPGMDRPLVGARRGRTGRARAPREGIRVVRIRAEGCRARAVAAARRRGGGVMRRLTRYIALEVLKGVGLTVSVLVAVTSFVELVGQLDDVGTNDYGFREALTYVALRLPRTVFEILPPAALIGALLSLGNMAVHRELIVMRASGVSNMQLLGAVSVAGFALLVVM